MNTKINIDYMKDELDSLLLSAQIDALKQDPYFIGMRQIQKNRLELALNNFDKDLDVNVYLTLQNITKELLDINIEFSKIVKIVYANPYLHGELSEFDPTELQSEWFDSLSRLFMNCDYPSYIENYTDDQLKDFVNRLKEKIDNSYN